MPTVPIIIYLEGTLAIGEDHFSYTASAYLLVKSFQILSRSATTFSLDLRRDGSLLDILEISGTDTGRVEIPELAFPPGAKLTLSTATVPVSPVAGVTIILECEVTDGVDITASTNLKRIQTPLFARWEGTLGLNETFFSYKPSRRMELTGYQITLRTASNANVVVDLKSNGITLTQLLLPSGQVSVTSLASTFIEIGDTLTLEIKSAGNDALAASMTVLLSYRNPEQTTFSSHQTPFVIEYEGLLATDGDSILTYTLPRAINLVALQAFVRSVGTENLAIGLYLGTRLIYRLEILAGQRQSAVVALSTAFIQNDILSLKFIGSTTLASAILVTLDYKISLGDDIGTYTFYSDPQDEIVLLARQVGMGGSKTDVFPLEKLIKYQQDVNNILNGRLRSLYRTPLRRVAGGGNPWPGSIQMIAQRMVMSLVMNDVFSEIEPNTTSNISNLQNMAAADLQLILTKEILLEGQSLRSKNAGSNAHTESLYVPQTPSTPIINFMTR